MYDKKFAGKMKRGLAGVLAAGMILTGMPGIHVEAASEAPGQVQTGQESSMTEDPPENAVEEPADTNPGRDQSDEGTEESGEVRPGGEDDGSGENRPGDGIDEPGSTKPDGEENESGDNQTGDGNGAPDSAEPGDSDNGSSSETDKPGSTTPGENQPDDGDNGSGDGNIPGDGQETEAPQPGTEDKETEPAEEDPAENGNSLNAVYSTQVSGNDISGNDLTTYEEETEEEGEGGRVVGGYIELPEDRDVSVVDESARIYDYEDGIAPLTSDSLPSSYIPVPGKLPLTRNQNPYGSCWAHSAMALAEMDMRQNGGASADADYSELHLAYFSYNGAVDDPLGGLDGDANIGVYDADAPSFMDRGGNLALAQYVLANWVGAADESTAVYPPDKKNKLSEAELEALVSKDSAFTDVAHLQNAFQINLQKNPDVAKEKILKYGGVGTSYCDANQYYKKTTNSYYCDYPYLTNHAVTIVGWDDTFSASNFSTDPGSDGAWLIRNSWRAGEDTDSITNQDNKDNDRYTYFWLSYFDKSLAAGYAFDFESKDNYDHNYQYDGSMASSTWSSSADSRYIANVFTAKGYAGGERLKAVGIAFAKANTPYSISIYRLQEGWTNPENGVLIEAASTSGTCECEGFYTIPLTNPVDLTYGETFSVVVKIEQPTNQEDLEEKEKGKVFWPSERSANADDTFHNCKASAQAGQSFSGYGSGYWTDFGQANNANLRIKAYTINNDGGTGELPTKIELQDELTGGIEVGVGDSYQASCTVLPSTASDTSVHWESDTPSVATVDADGLITGVSKGSAMITVTCVANESVTASFKVTVSSELKSIQIIGASSVTAGETITLQTIRSPLSVDAAGVQWSSSDEKVLTVDADGVVTGAAPGYASITAGIGEVVDTKEITCEFPDFSYTASPSAEGMTLTWPGGPGVKSYQIYRVEGTSWINPELVETITADDSEEYSYLDQTVEGGKEYTYQIEATVAYIKGDSTEEKIKSTERSHWTMPEFETFSIKYHLDGGTNADNNVEEYVSGETHLLYSPNRQGYTFAGWYTDEEMTHRIYLIASDTTGDLDLYAKWELTTYKIDYRLDFGINNEENKKSYTVEDETFSLLPPTKEGYCFAGWYTDSSKTKPISQIAKGTTGNLILYAKWIDISVITSIQVKPPTRTTYRTGEALDLSGGEVTFISEATEESAPLSMDMVSGFDSSKAGICRVTVSSGDLTADFETLIVAEPQVNAYCGQQLKEVKLPSNEYGVYSWKDEEVTLERKGVFSVPVSFLPNDEKKFQRIDLQAQITVADAPTDGALELGELTMQSESFTYTGAEQEPAVTITVKGVLLEAGRDYTVTYQNNKNVGTATVVAEGNGDYHGSLSHSFTITPAEIRIRAKNKTISVGDKIPGQNDYRYEVRGLLMNDQLIQEPIFSCGVTEAGTQKAGQYTITPLDADAGPNYTITYEAGQLTVLGKQSEYKVTFDVQGHGSAPDAYFGVTAGSTIEAPEEPEEKGFVFKGWCKDAACTQDWDFEADIVQSDITLYAKWLKKSTQPGNQFQMQEIEDVYHYTGKAWKPSVSVYDGETMLKAGRDYTVKYFNNINVNAGGVWKKGSGQGTDFNPDIPYVQITGKGNYTDEIKVNFDIKPAEIADGEGNPAEKVVLKYTDQFVTANKELKPFRSIKYNRAMKLNQDYTLRLMTEEVYDNSGKAVSKDIVLTNAAIPKGYVGRFTLIVTGIGNYRGDIKKTVYVKDKAHLMKNAKITLGKNQKSVELVGESVELAPSMENSADTFTVKIGTTILKPGDDYQVSYLNESNRRVGKATLVITGVRDYSGTKTAAFTVRGKAFTAGKVTVTGVDDKIYTGKAITQNDARLVYGAGGPDEKVLKYGTDYTVTYAKNINKGTATMTFTGSKEKGYSGSFKKTFQISADDITKVKRAAGWDTIVAEYSKAGAKPVTEISLINAGGKKLQNGKDYTLSYKNNKLVARASDEKAPTIIVKGKGNYQGTISIPFTIEGADLRSRIEKGEITVKTTAVAYQPKKPDDYVYQPAVKLMEGKTALRLGSDYKVTYIHNTQEDYNAYIAGEGKAGASVPAPQAIIEMGSDNTYLISGKSNATISVPLTIYRNKLTKANLRVEVKEAECVYTGTQVTPKVVVYYKGEDGEKLLTENKDYTVSYGANVKSGKKAGSLTISGKGTLYGGDVTVKFEIVRKQIKY